MPKKEADKKFQIQNNLAPVFQCFAMDSNRFKRRPKLAKTVIQTLTETIGNGDKRKRTWCWHSVQSSLVKVKAIEMCEWSKRPANAATQLTLSISYACYNWASFSLEAYRDTIDFILFCIRLQINRDQQMLWTLW